jgi:hypothetical protein
MILIPGDTFFAAVIVAAADIITIRETQRNAAAKTKAIEHKKLVLSTLNHSAQAYAGELNARWRSLTSIYDTLILVCLRAFCATSAHVPVFVADRAFAAF